MNPPPRFGISDYARMLLKRGPRLPIHYFLNAHLFDLRHGTETHTWLPKSGFDNAPGNLAHGVLYMASWTSEVRWSFARLRAIAGFERYTLLDIGCGKGKAVLEWTRLLRQHGIAQRVVGLDYYGPLLAIARNNHRIMFASEGEFLLADATTLDYDQFGNHLILYLYNPFDRKILGDVLARLPRGGDVIVIYNNPVEAGTVLAAGFSVMHTRHGFHPNCQTTLFRRNQLPMETER